jgi:hypothetical protein
MPIYNTEEERAEWRVKTWIQLDASVARKAKFCLKQSGDDLEEAAQMLMRELPRFTRCGYENTLERVMAAMADM